MVVMVAVVAKSVVVAVAATAEAVVVVARALGLLPASRVTSSIVE